MKLNKVDLKRKNSNKILFVSIIQFNDFIHIFSPGKQIAEVYKWNVAYTLAFLLPSHYQTMQTQSNCQNISKQKILKLDTNYDSWFYQWVNLIFMMNLTYLAVVQNSPITSRMYILIIHTKTKNFISIAKQIHVPSYSNNVFNI